MLSVLLVRLFYHFILVNIEIFNNKLQPIEVCLNLLDIKLLEFNGYQNVALPFCSLVSSYVLTEPNSPIMEVVRTLSEVDTFTLDSHIIRGELKRMTAALALSSAILVPLSNFFFLVYANTDDTVNTVSIKPTKPTPYLALKARNLAVCNTSWPCVCCSHTCCQWCNANLEDWKKSQLASNNSAWANKQHCPLCSLSGHTCSVLMTLYGVYISKIEGLINQSIGYPGLPQYWIHITF